MYNLEEAYQVRQAATKMSSENYEASLREFNDKQGAGAYLLVENIETLNLLNNQSIEMMFDRDAIYICA